MVITINFNNYKIKRAFLTLSLFLFVSGVFAQEINLITDLSVAERDFQFKLFENRFFQIPSLINQANIQNFTYGEGRYLYSEGTLRHPQEFKKQNGFELSTASLSSLENTNWTFYGGLKYLNTRIEEVEKNLTYGITKYDSPYYFFQNTTGLWNHQNYNFEASAANKINSKLTLGAYLIYDTNFYYRKVDTRNELTALKIKGKVAASYQPNKMHLFSVALSNEVFKTDSELGNKFPESDTELKSSYYLNTGLGSYIKNIDNGFETKRNIPEIQLQWLYNNSNWDLSVESTTKLGQEKWIDKAIVNVDENDELTNYSFTNQQIKAIFNKYKNDKQLVISLNAEYLKGKGEIWQEEGGYYYQNFMTTKYQVKPEAELLFYNKFMNKIGVGFNYYNRNQTDLNYAYQFDNSYFEPEISVAFNKEISSKTALYANFSGLYHYVLDLKHDPYAANNIYVDWIGNKVAAYTEISSYNINAKFGVNFKLENNNNLECSLTSGYWKVTDLPEESIEYYSETDDYLNLILGFKLYF